MARAIYGGEVIAESQDYQLVEGNVYFPPGSVRQDVLRPSSHHTVCGWKGTASYYHLQVGGEQNDDAAWYYPDPKPAAANIKGYLAFWRGVRVEV